MGTDAEKIKIKDISIDLDSKIFEDMSNSFYDFLQKYKYKNEKSDSLDINVPGIIIKGEEGNYRKELCLLCPRLFNEEANVYDSMDIKDSDDIRETFDNIYEESLNEVDSIILFGIEEFGEYRKRSTLLFDFLEKCKDEFNIYCTCREIKQFNKEVNPIRLGFQIYDVNRITLEEKRNIIDKKLDKHILSGDLDINKITRVTENMNKKNIEVFIDRLIFNSISKDMPSDNRVFIDEECLSETITELSDLVSDDFRVSNPDYNYKDIGGLDEEIEKVKETIEWPIENSELIEEFKCETSKGILLYGPPGTGKTLLAKAVAGSSSRILVEVKCSDVMQKYLGESEEKIKDFFEVARENKPSILFFDEFEAIGTSRNSLKNDSARRVVSQLLSEIDGIQSDSKVKIIASTNRPESIDQALLRSGRIDKKIKIPIPKDNESRLSIFNKKIKEKPTKELKKEELCRKMKNFTGGDIENVAEKASIIRIRKIQENNNTKKITNEDVEKAITRIKEKKKRKRDKSFM